MLTIFSLQILLNFIAISAGFLLNSNMQQTLTFNMRLPVYHLTSLPFNQSTI